MNIQLNQPVGFSKNKPSYLFLRGAMDILPLSISIIPWAILAGSMAIHAGLSFYKALAMSGLVFAGAAQLVSLSMAMEGASVFTIYLTIFFLTAQHFIYALTLRNDISILSLPKRLSLGFLLTDELFAVSAPFEKEVRNICWELDCVFIYFGLLLVWWEYCWRQ